VALLAEQAASAVAEVAEAALVSTRPASVVPVAKEAEATS
jgi:hypothetical protein